MPHTDIQTHNQVPTHTQPLAQAKPLRKTENSTSGSSSTVAIVVNVHIQSLWYIFCTLVFTVSCQMLL